MSYSLTSGWRLDLCCSLGIALKKRLSIAYDIDKIQHKANKRAQSNEWFLKAAEELDVDLDDDLIEVCTKNRLQNVLHVLHMFIADLDGEQEIQICAHGMPKSAALETGANGR